VTGEVAGLRTRWSALRWRGGTARHGEVRGDAAVEQSEAREMEGVGSMRGQRGVSTLRARHGFDAWRPRGVDVLKTVGHDANAFGFLTLKRSTSMQSSA
jgi:hypothetical protein